MNEWVVVAVIVGAWFGPALAAVGTKSMGGTYFYPWFAIATGLSIWVLR